jgi:hypothetical protein
MHARVVSLPFSPSSSEEGAGGWWRAATPLSLARARRAASPPPPARPPKRRGGKRSALLALVLLAGCQKSFDERYAEAQKKVSEQAKSIDGELAAKASEGALANEAPSEMPAAALSAATAEKSR